MCRYIYSNDEEKKDIPTMIEIFLEDTNKLKSLGMVKDIQFDFNRFDYLVRNNIRSMGWMGMLDTSFDKREYSARVHSDNCLQTIWNNPCATCMLCVVPLCIPHVCRILTFLWISRNIPPEL
jgi:hypothetical protein